MKRLIYASLLGILIGVLGCITVLKLTENYHKLESKYENWAKLNLVLQKVQENYVDTVDVRKISDAAIQAVMESLDPHSVYMPPVDLQDAEEDLAGGFDGIGIQFNVPNDTAVVIEAIPTGPAEKVGMRSGDRILEVDGKVIAGVKFPQDSMVRRMKGPAGTKVNILVGRGQEHINFEITRGKIPNHSVDAAFMINDTTAYLRLSKFSKTTATEVYESLSTLRESGMTNLVFDLRDNTGGFFDQALTLSNFFLPKDSLIVYIQGAHRSKEEFRANGQGKYQDIGLKLLINESTASSSEIFAGAIQDNNRGTIIGRRSFGKGLVQEPLYFKDGSGIRITVSRFYRPSGQCIQKPYSDDYDYEVYKRYGQGEMVSADSMKVENGGIIPDVFVPIDTTRATQFYISCNRKASAMRFASEYFDAHREEISQISDYDELMRYFQKMDISGAFLRYVSKTDGLTPKPGEWEQSKEYMLPQVEALVGRYSKLGEHAYYRMFMGVDETIKAAIAQ